MVDASAYANKQAVIETDKGQIVVKFFPDKAPNHVAKFCERVEQGFYNGIIFHRVIPGFMIQGGCPDGTGRGGPGYTIDQEFNDVSHKRGILSAARTSDPNSAGSQFFIMHKDNPGLDNQYTVFGEVVTGLEVVDAIATTPTAAGDRPITPIAMKSVTLK